MNKSLIPILVLLASSAAYAQTPSKKIELPPAHKLSDLPTVSKLLEQPTKPKLDPLTKAQLDFLKLPPLPALPTMPNVIYDYTVNVDRVTKDNPTPVRVYSSSGSGTDTNTSYFSSYKEIPYVTKCITVESKEPKCSYDYLKTGLGYMLFISKPDNRFSSESYDVHLEIELSEIMKWKKFENIKHELPEIRVLKINKKFAYGLPRGKSLEYKFNKKTFVFKNSDMDEEYIFTVTIEPTYKSKKETK